MKRTENWEEAEDSGFAGYIKIVNGIVLIIEETHMGNYFVRTRKDKIGPNEKQIRFDDPRMYKEFSDAVRAVYILKEKIK